ncbi:hypothetical protein OTU49_002623 [Cherax quadricarinatus]|uniref:RING-type domain-containing protein n=1 Tax=Cherax quadricarinatus TaxID=27406 RepID=A0AAW0XNH4_CHEQU
MLDIVFLMIVLGIPLCQSYKFSKLAVLLSAASMIDVFDFRFCAKQGWSHPQLVLILPPSQQANKLTTGRNPGRLPGREHIVFTSTTHLTVLSVLTWLYGHILSRVDVLQEVKQLEDTWLNVAKVDKEKVPRVVYISELLSPPLLIATLGLRLSTRIKLASFTVRKEEKEQVSRLLKKSGLSVPSIAVVTSEGVTSYGGRKGEPLTRPALNSYICTLQPHMNDAFLVSLIMANLLAVADFFYFLDIRIRAWKHVVRTFVRVLVYNVIVFLLWLAVTALLKFSMVDSMLQSGSWLITSLNSTWVFGQMRYHWLMVESHPVIIWLSIIIFSFITLAWHLLLKRGNSEQEEMDTSWWAVFPMDSYLVNVLFRPMASLSRPRPSQDLGLEEGMELLIERLATPDLWLHPVIPTDYMKDLPMWRYDGWGNEDDLKSESETDVDSVSENENDTLLDTHTCCQDDNCRLCGLWSTVKEIYVCHRCAILKRKLERQYLRYHKTDDRGHQNVTYERLLKVCENCCKTRKQQNSDSTVKESNKIRSPTRWLLSPQRLTELKWTAPSHSIESRICAICLGRYRWSAVLCGLPCGHNYHHSCITEWLLKDNHHCPTCRWPSYKNKLTTMSAHQHEE